MSWIGGQLDFWWERNLELTQGYKAVASGTAGPVLAGPLFAVFSGCGPCTVGSSSSIIMCMFTHARTKRVNSVWARDQWLTSFPGHSHSGIDDRDGKYDCFTSICPLTVHSVCGFAKKTSAASHSTFLVCMHLEGTISKFSAWVVALHYEHTITFILIQNYNITTPTSWPDHFKNACYGLDL